MAARAFRLIPCLSLASHPVRSHPLGPVTLRPVAPCSAVELLHRPPAGTVMQVHEMIASYPEIRFVRRTHRYTSRSKVTQCSSHTVCSLLEQAMCRKEQTGCGAAALLYVRIMTATRPWLCGRNGAESLVGGHSEKDIAGSCPDADGNSGPSKTEDGEISVENHRGMRVKRLPHHPSRERIRNPVLSSPSSVCNYIRHNHTLIRNTDVAV